MSPEKTKELLDKYPRLYRGESEGPQKNLMCFGFECGDGWFDLIDELSRQITEVEPDVKAFQVKEKFGTLRFYIGGFQGPAQDIIESFENCSGKICEMCGEPGEITGGGWLKTLCDNCNEAWLSR